MPSPTLSPRPQVDPLDDIDTINLELALADLGQIEKRLERINKGARRALACAGARARPVTRWRQPWSRRGWLIAALSARARTHPSPALPTPSPAPPPPQPPQPPQPPPPPAGKKSPEEAAKLATEKEALEKIVVEVGTSRGRAGTLRRAGRELCGGRAGGREVCGVTRSSRHGACTPALRPARRGRRRALLLTRACPSAQRSSRRAAARARRC